MANQVRYDVNTWEHVSASPLSKYRRILYDAGMGKDKCGKSAPNLKDGNKELGVKIVD